MSRSEQQVSEGVLGATMRLTVSGAGGRVDLVVPEWARVAELSERYADHAGLPAPTGLVTPTGRVLPPDAAIDEVGLRQGALLLATDGREPASADPEAGVGTDAEGASSAPEVPVVWTRAVTGSALLAALGVGLGDPAGQVRSVTAAALLAIVVVAVLPVGSVSGRGRRLHVVPAVLAAAGLVLVGTQDALLAVTVAALGALVGAGLARSTAEEDDPVSRVWLVSSGAVALTAAALLLLGAGSTPLWALGAAAGVLVARSLPALVVDVPDETLLDVSAMADTAWSARERERPGRGGRSGRLVRRPLVDRVVNRGAATLRAGTVACVAIAVPGALLLLRSAAGEEHWWRVLGASVSVGAMSAGTALSARAYRDRRLALLLRTTAAVLAVAVAAAVLGDASGPLRVGVVCGAIAVGALVVRAALALGSGWRSVWWARVADVIQGLCFVLVTGLLPVTTGLFDRVWGFT